MPDDVQTRKCVNMWTVCECIMEVLAQIMDLGMVSHCV